MVGELLREFPLSFRREARFQREKRKAGMRPPEQKMIWGEWFDVFGIRWYCRNWSCIHEVFNFTKNCVECVVAECLVSNYCVEGVFDRSN